MTELTLQTPECFKPLDSTLPLQSGLRWPWSGKSWHFASMVVEHCLLNPGSKIVCIRESSEDAEPERQGPHRDDQKRAPGGRSVVDGTTYDRLRNIRTA